MKKDDEIRDFNLSNIRYSPQETLQIFSVFGPFRIPALHPFSHSMAFGSES